MNRCSSLPLLLSLLLLLAWVGLAQGAQQGYGGIGLQVVPTAEGTLAVLRVLPGSPALNAGIQPGDLVVAVDGHSLRGSDFAEVARRYLWGKVGTSLTLTYLRPGQTGTHVVQLQRVALGRGVVQAPGLKMLEPQPYSRPLEGKQ